MDTGGRIETLGRIFITGIKNPATLWGSGVSTFALLEFEGFRWPLTPIYSRQMALRPVKPPDFVLVKPSWDVGSDRCNREECVPNNPDVQVQLPRNPPQVLLR